MLDGGDNLIGYFFSMSPDTASRIYIISDKGYILNELLLINGDVRGGAGNVFYASADCTGQGYSTFFYSGFVRLAQDDAGVLKLYYADKNSIQQTFIGGSASDGGGGCFALGEFSGWPVSPNDPAVTGISNQLSYTVPIKFEYTQ